MLKPQAEPTPLSGDHTRVQVGRSDRRWVLRVGSVAAAALALLAWPRMHARYGLWFWIWACGLLGYVVSFQPARRRFPRPAFVVCAVLGAILVLAAWLRLSALVDIPANISIDEILPSLEALHIAQGRAPNVFSSTGWFDMPNLTFAFAALVMRSVGGDAFFAARLASVLTGLGGVIVTFLLARRLFGDRAALVASFLLSVAFWHLHNSRTAFPFVQSSFWTALVIYLLVRGRQDRSRAVFAFAGLAAGLGLQCYFPVRILLLLCPLFFLAAGLRRPGAWRDTVGDAMTFAISALLALGPLLASVSWDLLAGHSQAVLITHPGTLQQLSAAYQVSGVRAVLRRNLAEATAMFTDWADVCVMNRSPGGLLDTGTLTALVVGVLLAFMEGNLAALALVGWAALTFVFGVVLGDSPRASYRLAAAMPALFVLAAYAVERFFLLATPAWRWYRWTLRPLLLVVIGGWILTQNYRQFFVEYAAHDGRQTPDAAVRRFMSSHCDGRKFYFVGDWLNMNAANPQEPPALDLFCPQHQPAVPEQIPTRVDVTRPATFFILSADLRLTDALRRCYPTVQVMGHHSNDGRLLFTSADVEPTTLAAGRGCVIGAAANQ